MAKTTDMKLGHRIVLKLFLFLFLIYYCTIFKITLGSLICYPAMLLILIGVINGKVMSSKLGRTLFVYLLYTLIATILLYVFKYNFSNVHLLFVQGAFQVVLGYAVFWGVILINKDKRALTRNLNLFLIIGFCMILSYLLFPLMPDSLLDFLAVSKRVYEGEGAIRYRYLFPGYDIMLVTAVYFSLYSLFQKRVKLSYYVGAFLGVLAVLITLTRSLWAGFFFSIGAYWFFSTNAKKKLITICVLITLLASLHFALRSSGYYQVIIERALSTKEETADESGIVQSSVAHRIFEYYAGLETWKENPIIGIGYLMPYREYFPLIDRYAPTTTSAGVEIARTYIENAYLHVLVYQGLIGLLLLLYLLYVFFAKLKDTKNIQDDHLRVIQKTLIYSFIAIVAGSALSGLDYSIWQDTIVIGFIMGFVESISLLEKTQVEKRLSGLDSILPETVAS